MSQTNSNGEFLLRTGLSLKQVAESRALHGQNVLTLPEREPWWRQFLDKFNDPVIRILMIAATLAVAAGAVHGEYIEGIGIICAILLATSLAFINEFKAAREFDILNTVNDEVQIKAIRNSGYTSVARKDIVVGDVVLLEIGEEVPADGEVLEAVSLLIDEAHLTGESMPVSKYPADSLVTEKAEQTYPPSRLLRGTMVVEGHCIMRVSAVGDATEIGKTARSAAEEDDGDSPLNKQLERLSKVIGVVGFGIAAVLFSALVVRGIVHGELVLNSPQWLVCGIILIAALAALGKIWLPVIYDAFELLGKEVSPPAFVEAEGIAPWVKCIVAGILFAVLGLGLATVAGWISKDPSQWLTVAASTEILKYFMVAVTVIVVAVPEGLAMSVTLSLAYSMRKMTANNNLVRRMNACETIGAATVICSDKTGTLTLGEMRVQELVIPAFERLAQDSPVSALGDEMHLAIQALAANSTAHLTHEPGKPVTVLGNPTEGALLMWLENKMFSYMRYRTEFKIERQWTFNTETKLMGTLGTSPFHQGRILHVKGAPELVLQRCVKMLAVDGPRPIGAARESLLGEIELRQKHAMRTLGFAWRQVPEGEHCDDMSAAKDLVWVGFAAIADPVREDVPTAIKICLRAGIKVKMVTGDVSATAAEIGRQIGLLEHDTPAFQITGAEFSTLDNAAARARASEVKIVSRARPMDKMRLVKVLKDAGEVVAVTGDGTNDAPALNAADVGLAMGRNGTAIAKEASDIVLLDDSFKSIVNAVMWGRSLYLNIQRFILFQLTINVTALGIALLGPFLGIQLPLTVIQMLWVNLIMDTFAALALATEPPHADVMNSPPRNASDFIVTPKMFQGIFIVGFIFLGILAGALIYMQRPGVSADEQQHELTLFFAVFVILQFWNLFNARVLGLTQSAFTNLFANRSFIVIALAILIGQIIITQFGGKVFRTTPLPLMEWLLIIGCTSPVLWVGEIIRYAAREKNKALALNALTIEKSS